MLANFRSKTVLENHILIFLANKTVLAGTIYTRFLIYLKAIYGPKKIKESYEIKILLIFSSILLLNTGNQVQKEIVKEKLVSVFCLH